MADDFPDSPTRTRKLSVTSTPARRIPSTSSGSTTLTASPHYTTSRRHSLYGTEDRVVIDPGSRVWKVGFSGESRPRAVFRVGFGVNGNGNTSDGEGDELWTLNNASANHDEQVERENQLYRILIQLLRRAFHDLLLTDPKSRKVIIIESPLIPLFVKELLSRVLFEHLQVSSVSFAPSGLLSLIGVGRITGLVVDCGHLETTVTPFFSSRPMYTLVHCTPLAGHRLNSHIRAMLLLFGTYYPPLASLSGAANLQMTPRATHVPPEVLTEEIIEEIKTRCCFVGDPLEQEQIQLQMSQMADRDTSSSTSDIDAGSMPPSSDVSTSSEMGDRSTDPRSTAIFRLYEEMSTATELFMAVTPPVSQQAGTGMGTLVIPGWVRERASEVLFDGGDIDEQSIVETVLECLRKVPMDLRSQLASTVLVTGGTAMLPGFISRLRAQMQIALEDPSFSSSTSSSSGRKKLRYDPYATIRSLRKSVAVINDPSPPPPSSSSAAKAGRAPAFSPALLSWVGGSLAGALKIIGHEVTRERWDEAFQATGGRGGAGIGMGPGVGLRFGSSRTTPNSILPDWSRKPLSAGAPIVNITRLQPQGSQQLQPHSPIEQTPSTATAPTFTFS